MDNNSNTPKRSSSQLPYIFNPKPIQSPSWTLFRVWDKEIHEMIQLHINNNDILLSNLYFSLMFYEKLKRHGLSVDYKRDFVVLQVDRVFPVEQRVENIKKLMLTGTELKTADIRNPSKWYILSFNTLADILSNYIKVNDILVVYGGNVHASSKTLTLNHTINPEGFPNCYIAVYRHGELEPILNEFNQIEDLHQNKDVHSIITRQHGYDMNVIHRITPIRFEMSAEAVVQHNGHGDPGDEPDSDGRAERNETMKKPETPQPQLSIEEDIECVDLDTEETNSSSGSNRRQLANDSNTRLDSTRRPTRLNKWTPTKPQQEPQASSQSEEESPELFDGFELMLETQEQVIALPSQQQPMMEMDAQKNISKRNNHSLDENELLEELMNGYDSDGESTKSDVTVERFPAAVQMKQLGDLDCQVGHKMTFNLRCKVNKIHTDQQANIMMLRVSDGTMPSFHSKQLLPTLKQMDEAHQLLSTLHVDILINNVDKLNTNGLEARTEEVLLIRVTIEEIQGSGGEVTLTMDGNKRSEIREIIGESAVESNSGRGHAENFYPGLSENGEKSQSKKKTAATKSDRSDSSVEQSRSKGRKQKISDDGGGPIPKKKKYDTMAMEEKREKRPHSKKLFETDQSSGSGSGDEVNRSARQNDKTPTRKRKIQDSADKKKKKKSVSFVEINPSSSDEDDRISPSPPKRQVKTMPNNLPIKLQDLSVRLEYLSEDWSAELGRGKSVYVASNIQKSKGNSGRGRSSTSKSKSPSPKNKKK